MQKAAASAAVSSRMIPQLYLHAGAIDVDELRTQTAAYLREHKDDFAPFLTNEKGDCMNAVRIIVIKKDKSVTSF